MIDVQTRPYYRKKINAELLQKAANSVLQLEQRTGNATILITGNKEIQALNHTYRQIDSPTDVLSFEDGTPDPFDGEIHLGDIVISFIRANQQARDEGHSVEDELMLLIVHGMLHLLGYDHTKPGDRKTMWKKQADILASLGINPGTLAYLEKV